MAKTALAQTFSTTGTVSNPLNLDSYTSPKGEHETVSVNGGGSGKKIRPQPKATLTSLTVNNVSSVVQLRNAGPPSLMVLSLQSGTLRKINSVVIPIVYSEKFYKDVLSPTLDDINKLSEYRPCSMSLLADISSLLW